MHYKKHTLKNGLRVILVPVKEMTTATVLIAVGTGSRYENEKENGLAHFLEHMFFKGTEKRPTAAHISRELDGLGAAYNAYTGKERTAYYAKVSSDKIMKAVDVVSDLFLHAKLEQKEITKESGAILQEINMYEDMPSRTLYDVMETLLYGNDHPLGREILGPKKNITSFKRKDFVTYLERCYSAENAVVCIAGNFPQGKVMAKIRKDFAHMAEGEKPQFLPFENTQEKSALSIKDKKTDQTHLSLAVRSGGYMDKDRYVWSVLANILGGGMSSRLFAEVREKRGLAYDVGAFMNLYPDTGTLMMQAGVEHENLTKAMGIILTECKKIAKEGVTTEELKRAKAGFEGRTSFSYESSDDIAARFAEQEVIRGKITLPADVLAKVGKVTRGDIKRVAKDLFQNKNLNCAIIGPHRKSHHELAKKLKF